MSTYDDLLDLPHHTSAKHPRMSRSDRAAQFSPFAALNGHDAAIRETGRLTEARIELTDDRKQELDNALQILKSRLWQQPELTLCRYVPDLRKAGGAYLPVSGRLKKIDPLNRTLCLTDGTVIPIDDVYEIASPVLQCPEES